MEFCGGHTVAILKHGIRQLLPPTVTMLSGPGCPVCVTDQGYIDAVLQLADRDDCLIATYGDMVRVPGTNLSLEKVRGEGADIRIVYSPLDCIQIAKNNFD